MTRRSAVPPPVTAVLDASSRWLPARLGEVEERLRETVAGHGEPLGEDATATLSAGGKRLRPMLVLLCAGEAGGDASVRAATAIELVHMATLVHDDVLDEAPLRRGLPTVAASSGRDRAVATGDLLLSRAFALLADAGDSRAVALLAEASVALARGELAQRHDAFDLGITEQRYLERCRLKTATLFECACLLGHDDEHLRAFGAEVGLAFQLLDDVLDVAGPPERTGKARGTDLLDGTVTLPLIEAAAADPGHPRGRPARPRPGRGRGALRPHRRHRRAGPGPGAGPGDGRDGEAPARRRQLRAGTAPAARPRRRRRRPALQLSPALRRSRRR